MLARRHEQVEPSVWPSALRVMTYRPGQRVHTQRRLPTPTGTLSFLAARATGIELEIIAHHGHTGQHVRAIADQRRPLIRAPSFPPRSGKPH